MIYKFAKQLLLRMPVKKPADYLAGSQSFLDDLHFRAAIRIATPSFYMILERHGFIFGTLNVKEATTLQKYINRYVFRPTPFGLFSSVSLIDQVNPGAKPVTSGTMIGYVEAAMPVQNSLGGVLLDNFLPGQAKYESNPSIYRILNEYRFFRTGLDDNGRVREYQLQSIAFSKVLKDLLAQGKGGFSLSEIISQIIELADCGSPEAEDYADFLIDAQLLIPVNRLNITGTDYLKHLSFKLKGGTENHLQRTLSKLGSEFNSFDPHLIDSLERSIDFLLKEKQLPDDRLNIILRREPEIEITEIDYEQKLRDGLTALELLSPTGQSTSMQQFIRSFQRHFEGQTLPLLQTLDPEAGIGYQQPEVEQNNPLLKTLHIPYRVQASQSGSWSAAHSLTMEGWLRDKTENPVIRLTDADLERLNESHDCQQLLGMSVLFRLTNGRIFIENAGGINAPALLGRFTVADKKIESAAREMANQLERLNPDIIFAELLHLSDPHTDNVNRRAHIYHYEIPLTAASTLPVEQQIPLADLHVRIVDNKAMLFSEQHNKVVIPRLTSAYNHSLNKLPLFRFLADLPYQYGRSNLGLDLRQLFPNLSFYPRVEYRDTILSLATWVINGQQITGLQVANIDTIDAFHHLSRQIRLPRHFLLAESDQELVFDSQNDCDILFFVECLRQKKEAVLKEFLEQSEVKQYNAYLLPTQPLVLPKVTATKAIKTNKQRKYMPGSSWLYLKLYAPKVGTDRLLLQLAPLLSKRYTGHKINQWFFIRYDDNAPHIRLRMQVSPDAISQVLTAFKGKLEERIQQHVIREFQIDVYSRELERYAAGGIENTEHFFWASSDLVIHFLKEVMKKSKVSTHVFALYSTYVMIREFILEADEQLNFTLLSHQQFLPEFTERSFKVDLDKKYRELTPEILSAFQIDDPAIYSGSLIAGANFRKSLQLIRKHMGGATDTEYLKSIIHMHLNRVFTDESRKQEMICYYLLHKYLLSVKGRPKRKN